MGTGLLRKLRFIGLILLAALLFPADAADHVPGRLLVGRQEAADSRQVETMLRLHRASVRRRLDSLGAAVLEVPEEATDAILSSLRQTGLFRYVERDHYAHTAAEPNDPSYGSQWHLPKIQSAKAWDRTTGRHSVVVAVIDTGVYASHPDLASKLMAGWNFVDDNGNTSDVLGHGTAVAGTIAAASNNGIGVAGVSWDTPIMPLKVVADDNLASYSDIASAIVYAVDRGVRLINISIGGQSRSDALQDAVTYAWSKGAVIFASAMNNSISDPFYPAACTHVVAVGATDAIDHIAAFSNWGNWITLTAPGTSILTTALGGGYGFWSGTSFASPIVAGVAALCLSINPALTNLALVAILEQTADDLGMPGYDNQFGWGRINAFKAVAAASPLPAPAAPVSTAPVTAAPANAPSAPPIPVVPAGRRGDDQSRDAGAVLTKRR